MGKTNPLVESKEEPEPEAPVLSDELLGERTVVTGPSEPRLTGQQASATQSSWPRVTVTPGGLVTVAGLHGGSGASTVASLFGGETVDAGVGWPAPRGWQRPLPTLNVVMVARTHRNGLELAADFARCWNADQLPESRLLGLILVDDGPKLWDQQRRSIKRLLKMTPLGAHIPWVENWRAQPPDTDKLPRRIQKITQEFTKSAQQHSEGK